MAPWMLLLLPALCISLLMSVPSHCTVDPTSTTLAISQATGTVCSIAAGSLHHTIQCMTFPEPANSTVVPIHPAILFDAMLGGPNFICGLMSGGGSFYCWDGIGQEIRRIYDGPPMLGQLSVGATQVAAIDEDRMMVRWWRHCCGSNTKNCTYFPESVSGEYNFLTSGDDFSCALNRTNGVQCWGPGAEPIQTNFSGTSMSSITAGGSRVCGLTEDGYLKCTGDSSNVPPGKSFQFRSIAIGLTQTCAISTTSRSVVCWGQNGEYFPMPGTPFVFIVAGGDLMCGLTAYGLKVACWGVNGTNSPAIIRSLPKILPGVCVEDKSICNCGFYSESEDLCRGSGVICLKYISSCQFSPPANGIGIGKWNRSNRLLGIIVGGIFCYMVVFCCWLWQAKLRRLWHKISTCCKDLKF